MAVYKHLIVEDTSVAAAQRAVGEATSLGYADHGSKEWGSVHGFHGVDAMSRFNPQSPTPPICRTEQEAADFLRVICERHRYTAFGVRFEPKGWWCIGAFCRD